MLIIRRDSKMETGDRKSDTHLRIKGVPPYTALTSELSERGCDLALIQPEVCIRHTNVCFRLLSILTGFLFLLRTGA